jgi:hypothetical protein
VVNVLPYITFTNSTFCPRSVLICFVWISEQKVIISLYSINIWFLLTRSIVFTLRYKRNFFVQLRLNLDTVFTSALQFLKWSDFIILNRRLRNKDTSVPFNPSLYVSSFLPSFLPSLPPSLCPALPCLSLSRFNPAWQSCYILQEDDDSSYPNRCFASPCLQADFFRRFLPLWDVGHN